MSLAERGNMFLLAPNTNDTMLAMKRPARRARAGARVLESSGPSWADD